MKIEVEIRRPAKPSAVRGTLAWLTANIGHINLGATKSGNNGAWLYDKDGKSITVLCLQNSSEYDDTPGDPAGPITLVSNSEGNPYEGHDPADDAVYTDIRFTDAAFRVIEKLARAARDEILAMLEEQDGGDDDEVEVVVVRVKDRDAAALAAASRSDPAVIPILRDRLGEVV